MLGLDGEGLMDSEFQAALNARVAHVQAISRTPSVVVAVGADGEYRSGACAGFGDIENRTRVTEDSSFRIGSITKTFTAALTVLLAERGELSLEATVGEYLSGTRFGHLPLRMLLSHSSGLQREVPGDMWTTMRGPAAEQLHDAFQHVELVAEPGQRWHYSNLGYAVLGQIIEAVTGQPCDAVIEQTLVTSLGLAGTRWTEPEDAVVGYRLDPYAGTVQREPVMQQAAVGVGGQLWSTPKDLLRWGNALIGGEPTVVPMSVVDKMHTLQIMADTSSWTRGWGLGLILYRYDDRIFAGHTGAMPGFQSAMMLDRGTGTVVSVSANATRGIEPADLAAEVLQLAIADLKPETVGEWRPAQCPDHVRPLLGRWWMEADETVFRWEHDGLHAHLATDPSRSDTRFVAEGRGRFRAAEGRLQGELLEIYDTADGVEMCWATYPVTRMLR